MSDLVERIQKEVPYFEEYLIGCCLENYGTSRCGKFRSYGCKNAARCEVIRSKVKRYRNEQAG